MPHALIENKIERARIYAPNGEFLQIRRKKKELMVIDRAGLDKFLADKATDEGATFSFSNKVTQLVSHKFQIKGCAGKSKDGQWQTKALVTICAEGVHGRILRQHGYPSPNHEWNLSAVQYEVKNVEIDRDRVDLYHGSQWAPGFFAWIIPTRDNSARVGLAAMSKPRLPSRRLLDKFLIHHPIAADLLKGYRVTSVRGGTVPAAGPSPRTVYDGLVVVGDAAGQAKPTTGGGVNIGGHCARIAGAIISDALESNQCNINALRKYENSWRHLYQRELLLMSVFRRSFGRVPNKMIDETIGILKNIGVEKMLANVEDIDLHATELVSWLLKPNFLRQAAYGIPFLALGIYSAVVNS